MLDVFQGSAAFRNGKRGQATLARGRLQFRRSSRRLTIEDRSAAAAGDRKRQVVGLQEIAFLEDHGAFESVFEFADIAGPVVVEKQAAGFFGNTLNAFAKFLVVVREEEFNERKNVFLAVAERR